jgi:ppGpp synthetase/RelA/SpoT-type nucleotidyltranferase
MSDVIESFVAAYLREFDFYKEAARLCALRCEKLLEVNGIRAMVTFRAKRPDRLRDKLLKRDGEKNYSSEDEIRADVADLTGVRAALYFPCDREKFAKLVADAFAPFKRKNSLNLAQSEPKSDSADIMQRTTGFDSVPMN